MLTFEDEKIQFVPKSTDGLYHYAQALATINRWRSLGLHDQDVIERLTELVVEGETRSALHLSAMVDNHNRHLLDGEEPITAGELAGIMTEKLTLATKRDIADWFFGVLVSLPDAASCIGVITGERRCRNEGTNTKSIPVGSMANL